MDFEKTMNPMNSIGYFNFARGIGILFVIIGHSVSLLYPLEIGNVWYTNLAGNIGFATMAMFFMISGFGFRRTNNKKCIRTQARLLLLPYGITVVCVLGAKLLLAILKHRSFFEYGGDLIFSYLLAMNRGFQGTILGLPVNNVAMLWFFITLFGSWCICNAICAIDSEKVQVLLVGACVAVGVAMTVFSKVWPFCIPHILQAVGFLYAGKKIKELELLQKKLPISVWVFLLLVFGINVFFGGVDMYTCIFQLLWLDYLGGLCGGFLLLRFFAWLQNHEPSNLLYEFISDLGFDTLTILCIHAFDEKVIPWHRWDYLFAGKEMLGVAVYAVIRIVFIVVAFLFVTKIKKLIIRKFFRKKKHSKIKITLD